MSLVTRAREFALAKHKDQKYGNEPYEYHLKSVANICSVVWGYEEYVAVAWLHDVLEDTETTYDELRNEFGENIASNVLALSNDKLSKEKTFKAVACHQVARRVKLADRLCNMSETLIKRDIRLAKKYTQEYGLFKTLLFTPTESDFWAKLEPIYNDLLDLIGEKRSCNL